MGKDGVFGEGVGLKGWRKGKGKRGKGKGNRGMVRDGGYEYVW